jgi:hypothetical protein
MEKKKKQKRQLVNFRLGTFDCESCTFNKNTGENGGADKIDMLGFFDGETYFHFNNGEEFVSFIFDNIKKYNGMYIYAHYFSGYDFYAIWEHLNKPEYRNYFSTFELHNRIVGIDIEYARCKIFFRDSFKLLPSSLASLGKSYGAPKLEMPDSKITSDFKEHYKNMLKYNENDCRILYKILKSFFKDIEYPMMRIPLTTPSLSYRIWKEMNGIKMASELSNACFHDDYFRKSYAGGRTEVFKHRIGEETYSYLDVNSLYPSVMEANEFPVGNISTIHNEREATKHFENGYDGVYEADWIAPNLPIPILWSKEDKLMFKLNKANNNHGYGYYTYPELKLAEDNGYTIFVKSAKVFYETKHLFKEFVGKYKEMKFEGGAKKETAKLMLNSLYGKMGQRLTAPSIIRGEPRLSILENILKLESIHGKDNIIEYDPQHFLFKTEAKRNPRDVMVIWASYITSLGRCKLWKAMRDTFFSVAYCDTDSIIIPKRYASKVDLDTKRFGAWKEEMQVDRGVFWCPKTYIVDGTNDKGQPETKLKLKGLPKDNIQFIKKMPFESIVDYINSKPQLVTYKIVQIPEGLRRNIIPGTSILAKKKMVLNYDKRMSLPDGTTEPY